MLEASRYVLLVLLVASAAGCRGLSRDINQSLPEFMRAQPGEEEMEILTRVRRSRTWTEEDLKLQDSRMDQVRERLSEDRLDDAIDLLETYLEDFPNSKADEEARFLLAKAQKDDDAYAKSFDTLKDFTLLYPVSDHGEDVMNMLFEMGRSYLAGERSTLFGIFSNTGKGRDIMTHLVESYPSGVRAADAEWALGEYAYENDEWERAAASYGFLVEQYPTSEWVPMARLKKARSLHQQVKGAAYDPVTMKEAREAYLKYVEAHAEHDGRDEADRAIASLEDLQAAHLLVVAEWYLDQDRPYSARYYLVAVKNRFPDSPSATRARELLPEIASTIPLRAQPDELPIPGATIPVEPPKAPEAPVVPNPGSTGP